MHFSPVPIWLLVVIALAGFPLGLLLLRHASGWTVLARHYAARQPFTGRVCRFQNAALNALRLNNCLSVGADGSGLFLGTVFPFSVSFPPLLVPWADISAAPKKGLLSPLLAFQFAQAPGVTLTIAESLGRDLQAARPGAS